MSNNHVRFHFLEFFLTLLSIISLSSIFYFVNDVSYDYRKDIVANGIIKHQNTAIICFSFILVICLLSIVWIEISRAKFKKE